MLRTEVILETGYGHSTINMALTYLRRQGKVAYTRNGQHEYRWYRIPRGVTPPG